MDRAFVIAFCCLYHLCSGLSDQTSSGSDEATHEINGYHTTEVNNRNSESSMAADYTKESHEIPNWKYDSNAEHDAEPVIISPKILKQYNIELQAGNTADLLGTNQHYYEPNEYPNFGRRFVPQYPYTEIKHKVENSNEDKLTPKLAPPELVLAVAKESALLEAAKQINPTDDIIRKDILRTGEYWNGVWREDVNPEGLLRTSNKKKTLDVINAKIKPGSHLYELVVKLKAISPQLMYVINKEQQK